jgi:hypothetical protein
VGAPAAAGRHNEDNRQGGKELRHVTTLCLVTRRGNQASPAPVLGSKGGMGVYRFWPLLVG